MSRDIVQDTKKIGRCGVVFAGCERGPRFSSHRVTLTNGITCDTKIDLLPKTYFSSEMVPSPPYVTPLFFTGKPVKFQDEAPAFVDRCPERGHIKDIRRPRRLAGLNRAFPSTLFCLPVKIVN